MQWTAEGISVGVKGDIWIGIFGGKCACIVFIVGGDRVDAALIADENVSGTSVMLKFKHVNISGTGSRILSSFRVPHLRRPP